MVLTPGVVGQWIRDNITVDKDKSVYKKELWELFHKEFPELPVSEGKISFPCLEPPSGRFKMFLF